MLIRLGADSQVIVQVIDRDFTTVNQIYSLNQTVGQVALQIGAHVIGIETSQDLVAVVLVPHLDHARL